MSRINPDIDPDEVIRRARLLGQVQPTADEVQRAVGRARDLITNHTRSHRPVGRLIMKIGIPATLAATAAVVVAIMLMSGPAVREATAAEKLDAVLKENSNYKGWIHIEQAGANTYSNTHFNTVDNTLAMVGRDEKNEITVTYLSPKDKEVIRYDSKTNTLEKGDLGPIQAVAMAHSLHAQASPESIIEDLRNKGTKLKVERTTQGEMDLFTITLDQPQNMKFYVSKLIVLTDPKSKLITEVREIYNDGEFCHTKYTYGPPEIKDIYSLPIPGEKTTIDSTSTSLPTTRRAVVDEHAKIVDNRSSPQTRKLIDQLEARVQKGFGDGMGVLTRTPVKDGKLNTGLCFMEVFLLSGDDAFHAEYRLGTGKNDIPSLVGVPKGWPRPDAKDVLLAVRGASPRWYFLKQDEKAWGGEYDEETNNYTLDAFAVTGMRLQMRKWRAWEGVAGVVWPSADAKSWSWTRTKIELLADKNHPGQQGLSVTKFSQERPEVLVQGFTWWVDSAKNDVPTEVTYRDFNPDDKTLRCESHTKYLEYAQLPDSRWYPTRWQETRTLHGKETDVFEYNLQIFPGAEIDKAFFVKPTPPTTTSAPAPK